MGGFGGGGVAAWRLDPNARLDTASFQKGVLDSLGDEAERWKRAYGGKNSFAKGIDPKDLALYGIIGVNLGVFLLWQLARRRARFDGGRLEQIMNRHFTVSWEGVVRKKRVHTLLTSAFSHFSVLHFGLNMWVLHNFAAPLLLDVKTTEYLNRYKRKMPDKYDWLRARVHGLLPREFVEMYVGGAVLSSITSVVFHAVSQRAFVQSLGASGAVFGVVALFCLNHPDSRISIFPFPWSCDGWDAFHYCFLINGAGALAGAVFARSLVIDFAGHLGGCVVGWYYGRRLYKQLQRQRRKWQW